MDNTEPIYHYVKDNRARTVSQEESDDRKARLARESIFKKERSAALLAGGFFSRIIAGSGSFDHTIKDTGNVGRAVSPNHLVEYFIAHFTVAGDTVLDPFCGTGKTLKIANKWECDAVGFERDNDTVKTLKDAGFQIKTVAKIPLSTPSLPSRWKDLLLFSERTGFFQDDDSFPSKVDDALYQLPLGWASF